MQGGGFKWTPLWICYWTVTWQQEQSIATSSLFLSKMIANLERTLSITIQGPITKLPHTMGAIINNESTPPEPLPASKKQENMTLLNTNWVPLPHNRKSLSWIYNHCILRWRRRVGGLNNGHFFESTNFFKSIKRNL